MFIYFINILYIRLSYLSTSNINRVQSNIEASTVFLILTIVNSRK
jgi:hypothetical protein